MPPEPPLARLSGPNGSFVEFSVVGYQFPSHVPTDEHDYDANWLVVQFRASDGRRTWGTRDPAWLTSDLPGLAAWLRVVASGSRPPGPWTALEPLLTLDCSETRPRRITASLALELRSPDAKVADKWDEAIELSPQPDELLYAADAVDAALGRFPPR